MKIKLYKYWKYFNRVFPYVIFLPIVIFKKTFNKDIPSDIWLIGEREDEARDNGYHLFKYIRTNYPNKNVYYVIDFKSSDYAKVKKYGNLIQSNSLKHYEFFFNANKLISTHVYGAAPGGKAGEIFVSFSNVKDVIHIRHGIAYNRYNDVKIKKLNLITAASELEKNIINDANNNFNVQILGLARYDNLQNSIDKNNRFILLMPTWRSYIQSYTGLSNDIDLFENEPYYIYWNNLLTNKELLKLLKKYNIKLKFYPHYRIQNYLSSFNIVDHDYVQILNKEDFDVQDLLNSCSMLLTDYSSVLFDVAYLKKPSLYYQFDSEKFYTNHYKKSSFTFEEDGFGTVCTSEESLIKNIKNYIENDFLINPTYLNRINQFFTYNDRNNCERIFEYIDNQL